MKDRCVLCNKETEYDKETHIDYRNYYVECCGQLCKKCWDCIYGTQSGIQYTEYLNDW